VIDFDTFKEDCIDVARRCAEFADIIWFRIKGRPDVYERAKKMREALPQAYLSLSVDADIAYGLGYESVQLTCKSDVEAIRKKYPSLRLGYSAHNREEIAEKNADYFTISPVFYTSKDYEVKPIGVSDVSDLGKEIYALGGITPHNVHQLKGMGYAGVAGISFYKDIEALRRAVLA